jgi:uncharacterized repeat protein (TIGR02543 family)/LPXTG-motif cell wall-anchored protein
LGKSVQFLPAANDVTGSMTAQSETATSSLTTNAFNRPGYVFTGWNTSEDGRGTPYANEASYSFASDLTLYAQWEVATSTPPTTAPVSVPVALAATGASETSLILPAIAASLLGFGLLLAARRSRTKFASRDKRSRIELDS